MVVEVAAAEMGFAASVAILIVATAAVVKEPVSVDLRQRPQ